MRKRIGISILGLAAGIGIYTYFPTSFPANTRLTKFSDGSVLVNKNTVSSVGLSGTQYDLCSGIGYLDRDGDGNVDCIMEDIPLTSTAQRINLQLDKKHPWRSCITLEDSAGFEHKRYERSNSTNMVPFYRADKLMRELLQKAARQPPTESNSFRMFWGDASEVM